MPTLKKNKFSDFVTTYWKEIDSKRQSLVQQLYQDCLGEQDYAAVSKKWLKTKINLLLASLVNMIYIMPDTSLHKTRQRTLKHHLELIKVLRDLLLSSQTDGNQHPVICDYYPLSFPELCKALEGRIDDIASEEIRQHKTCLQKLTRVCIDQVTRQVLQHTLLFFGGARDYWISLQTPPVQRSDIAPLRMLALSAHQPSILPQEQQAECELAEHQGSVKGHDRATDIDLS